LVLIAYETAATGYLRQSIIVKAWFGY